MSALPSASGCAGAEQASEDPRAASGASARTPWLVWQRGLSGPVATILYGEGGKPPLITGYQKELVYPGTVPIALTPAQAALPYALIQGLFPPPAQRDDA